MTKTVIEVEELRKSYGSLTAIDGLSFGVEEGEIFGLLGLNGAGKTTAVECIQGLRRADSGRIRVLGLDPRSQVRELRRVIGSQLQESALPDHIRVWEALDLFASLGVGEEHGISAGRGQSVLEPASKAARVASWEPLLEQWGLSAKRKAAFGSLSGGQRQRLFVALALVNRPRVVFLDEMTTGLDAAARRVAWELIRAIRERGTTVVLVTHFMDEAERLCDRVAVIKAGKVAAMDSPQGLIAKHADEITVRFGVEQSQADTVLAWLKDLRHVKRATWRAGQVEVSGSGPLVVAVAAALGAKGMMPEDLRVEQPTLEEVFLSVVGQTPEGMTDRGEL